MGAEQVLNESGKGKQRDLETDLVMVIGQLNWFAEQIEHLDNIAPSLVLRGMVGQLEALVDPIAELQQGVRS